MTVTDWLDPARESDLVAMLTTLRFQRSVWGGAEHEFTRSNNDPDHTLAWLIMRDAIARYGYDKTYGKTPKTYRYLDLPDGYTYWVMAPWKEPDADLTEGDPATTGYVLNRRRRCGGSGVSCGRPRVGWGRGAGWYAQRLKHHPFPNPPRKDR